MTDTTRAAARGRTDALLALERAREAYAAAGQALPTDPRVLQVVAAYAPPREEYAEPELQAYEAAWYDVIFSDAITRLLQKTMSSLGSTIRDAASALGFEEHTCDEDCTVAAVAECGKHGLLGTADDERGVREMMLEHLRSHHPRRGHHEIARLTEELGR